MKSYIGLGIIILFMLFIFYFGGKQFEEGSQRRLEKIKHKERLLGNKIVLDRDTLTVLDYYRGYYYLSNNMKVREEIINKLIIE